MGQKLFYRGDFNKNHRSGFPQSSKRKPVEKYDNKFNSKNGTKKQSIIPTYQTLDQFIIGQKGSNKKCDSKNGVSQSKRKLVEKFNPKNESKKQSMISTYQMEESKELPISDILDQASGVYPLLAHSKYQNPLSQETQFFQKICKTEKDPLEDGTGQHFFFKKQDTFLLLEEAIKEESEALMEASENSDNHEEYLAYIHERIPEVSKNLNNLDTFIKKYSSMPQECVPFIFRKDFQTVKFVSSVNVEQVLMIFL